MKNILHINWFFFKKYLLTQRELTVFFTFTPHLVNKFLTQNMARTIRLFFVLLLLGYSGTVLAQPGAITGKVLDDKKQPVIGAVIEVFTGGIRKGGAVTDYDGIYIVKPIEPGRYNVKISYTGYTGKEITDVIVSPDKTVEVNGTLSEDVKKLNEFVKIGYRVPLIDKYDPNASNKFTSEKIEKLTTRNTNDIAAQTTGVYQAKKGNDLNIGGARSTGTQYIIDGVVQQTPPNGLNAQGINLSQGSIDQLEVMGSGIPAKYGDASGGIINITTKGVSSKLSGDILAQHSIDGYNNSFVSFNLSGPLVKKAQKDGSKKPVMGFNIGGDFYDDHDRSPSYLPTYVAPSSLLNSLLQNPLRAQIDPSTGQTFYQYNSEYVTLNQLNAVKAAPNDKTTEARAHAKLDFQISDNLSLTAAGNLDYQSQNNFSQGAVLFAPTSIPTTNYTTASTFIRFTQRFGKSGADNANSPISNAYYSVQADYQLQIQNQQDQNFKNNIFDYAYIGKFYQKYSTNYLPGQDSITKLTGVLLQGYQNPDSVYFTPSKLNPDLANYTSELYSLRGANNLPLDRQTIESQNGLLNGDLPNYTYQEFLSPGSSQSLYLKRTQQQYSLSVDASFDLLLGHTKHNIEFGLTYQQRIQSFYGAYANPNGYGAGGSIWGLMRQLANSHISVNKSDPIWIKDGKQYQLSQINYPGHAGTGNTYTPGASDTIVYPLNANAATQSTFDRNLRIKLGLDPNGTDILQTDTLNPNQLSLGMFSADELWNSGKFYTSYYGYNYDGSAQTGNVSFNDWWTAKDKNGNYTRPLAPFQPNYTAGYLLDKFTYKDMNFNIGLRIERFDANTSVLIDPYSFYPEKTVNEVSGSLNLLNNGAHPTNIGGNYVVYVNDNTSSSPSIIGYRSGDQWYDPTGKAIEDPSLLKNYSGGRDPQPYLVNPKENIRDTSFKPGESFVQYTPQVRILPRLQFSFPIADDAQFFAHYDVYSQRPDANFLSRPSDYFFLQSNPNTIINNPNLKPATTFDYEVGFQQKLTERSAITLTASYKERKDMITMRPYLYAWPITYYTYGNRDFSTTKATTLKYDLRRFNHLTVTVAYTLSFAEGTGSTPTSGNAGGSGQVSTNGLLQNFIEAGLPNLRYVSFLNIDSRHLLSANFDYRFMDGEGPEIGGKHILQNAGMNLTFSARSGEPYTAYQESDAISHTVLGGVNGSRLPWHYGVDVKFDKDFALSIGKKHTDAEQGIKVNRPLSLNAFVLITNLLNTRDILGVYGYTGKPDDNGYLASATGQHFVQQQTSPLSYTQLYNIAYNDPGHYNLPRQISIGLQLNF